MADSGEFQDNQHRICSEPGCELFSTARGRCHNHYGKYRAEQIAAGTWQPMSTEEQVAKRKKAHCSAPGCEAEGFARGLCTVHYRRHVKEQKAAGTWEPRKLGWSGDPEEHAEAGKKGGTASAQDRERMQQAGKKGGAVSAADRGHMAEIGRRGAEARVRKTRSLRELREQTGSEDSTD